MPLVLSMKAGEDFYVGENQFMVDTVNGEVDFILRNTRTGETHRITDKMSVPVLEDVFISAGDRPQTSTARVAIDAPREIEILRGVKKRAGARRP